ncbi:MAG: TIGR04086 family membrane protein [Ruminococcus sp.]|nr:TIGR04086 family membrane protein [Ruminococcus sp.]
MRNRRKNGVYFRGGLSALISAAVGATVVFAGVTLISLLMTGMDMDDKVLSVLTSAALCAGSFAGGLTAARRRRQNGLLMGLLCGLFLFGVIFLLSYLFAGAAGGMKGGRKLVMTLICASVGGIIGVNTNGNSFHIR